MHNLGTPDPQWEYALVIRAALELHGRYVVDVDTRDAQARVDIHWAARQAARLLGVRVTIERSAPFGHADSTATMTVRCVASGGPERALAQAGLERLRKSVREAALNRD
jgi:hypothetical protein